ncbi:hypothetical protein F5X68DRAFT_68579 [Plectosphaerella plurivora]|uniref:Rhodopsin domain-containing protein n=1 Tax=Plectosphaerella plurivora TaxID=936078 RepID=A0A9P8VFI7_9PEZI|nr:hypothetical protein F5X68DRAFT_68579 [Plectosphaerella plurivora]
MAIQSPGPAVELETDSTYLPEVWSLYAIGVIVILVRIAVRLRTVGVRGFHGDDYLVFFCLAFYTANAVIVQVTYYTGANIDVTPEETLAITDTDEAILEYGSKLEFASWYTYPAVIWVLKLQLLFFYSRITLGVFQTKTIKALFGIIGITWAALILSVSLTCRPFHWNWQIRPLPGPTCTFRPQNFLILVVLNVVSDVAVLIVPVPILWNLRVHLLRKLGVALLLCSGLFVISTAIVRAVQTLGGAPSIININRWGFRETAVGILAVTAPVLAPLFTPEFWKRGPYHRHRPKPDHRPPVLDGSGQSESAPAQAADHKSAECGAGA